MSVASSFPCLKLQNPCSTSCSPPSSSSSSASTKSKPFLVSIRSSQTDQGPLRRPTVPSLNSPPSLSPSPPTISSPAAPPPKLASPAAQGSSAITLEFQRQKAKELQEYFKKKKIEEADQGPFFGFIGKNEISNGRWAMFGFAVGLLTEYATGSDFVDQVKILLSNFGILDLD